MQMDGRFSSSRPPRAEEEKRRAASKSSKKCDRVSVWPGQVWWLEPAQGVKTFGQEGAVR